MNINRRNFLAVLGVTGVSLATGTKLQASRENENDTEFYGVLYDSTRCVGCQGCETACAEEHGLPEPDPDDMPEVGKVRKANENRRTVVNVYDTSQGEVYVKNQCMHCNQPACTSACLTRAMQKTMEGPVTWTGDKCMGCRYCMVSCPFDVPKFEYHSANPKIVKCNMCYERVVEGKLPACVENCPAEALTFGTRRELVAEAHRRISENPDVYFGEIYGETEAGGTGFLYLSPVPFKELGFNTSVQKSSYPELTKGFLYSVPTIFVLWPAALLGIQKALKNNTTQEEDHE
ncbi:MAG: 4Fe-4S dicluster domain-containing protein [Bacteroidales bacterium]|nr:4Fe-4S dicluster domain-containing protein [Bacteroidales bacterium]